ncbi:hypothetical protein OUZ56_011704 [Daphnia magna]|uniref:Uncharacterized protein n=1 Tax=Daphnia magna TaxID=35525 RepID=A0ABQ9Z155_9CRUS|nr:hypothetical protein OUZ56_011704 [Daphnia magna]
MTRTPGRVQVPGLNLQQEIGSSIRNSISFRDLNVMELTKPPIQMDSRGWGPSTSDKFLLKKYLTEY